MKKIIPLALLFWLVGCGENSTRDKAVFEGLGKASRNTLAVVVSDYTTGQLTLVDLEKGAVQEKRVPIHQDSYLRIFNGTGLPYFVVNRLGADSIQKIDPSTLESTEFSVGRGTNAQDILVLGSDAYVTRRGNASLLQVDWKNPGRQTTHNLSQFDRRDGNPDLNFMAEVNLKVWIQAQNLVNEFPADQRSSVLVFDPLDGEIETEIPLSFKNPVSEFRSLNGAMYVACAGKYGVLDGAIEGIEKNSLKSGGVLITEADLGGDLINFVFLEKKRKGVALIGKEVKKTPEAQPTYMTQLVEFDYLGGTLKGSYHEMEGFTSGLLYDSERDLIYVADRNKTNPAVIVLEAENLGKPPVRRIDVNGPPIQLVLAP